MTCPCQKEVENLENAVIADGSTIPEPTLGVKIINFGANVLFTVICAFVAIALLPFALVYVICGIFFKVKTTFSTKNIVNFVKLFG